MIWNWFKKLDMLKIFNVGCVLAVLYFIYYIIIHWGKE